MSAARQELEKRRTRIVKEVGAVFRSTEKIWRSMDAGSTSGDMGRRLLIGNRERLIVLSRQEREINSELLQLEESA